MKLVSRDTCRAISRDAVDDLPEKLRMRMRNLRFLEETRSGRHRDGRFPPYVSGCPENVAVGAVAAVAGAAGSQTDGRRPSMETRRRSTFVDLALSRYGNTSGVRRGKGLMVQILLSIKNFFRTLQTIAKYYTKPCRFLSPSALSFFRE